MKKMAGGFSRAKTASQTVLVYSALHNLAKLVIPLGRNWVMQQLLSGNSEK
jgi:hypothetical protein